jgi:PEP-CTERM motif
MTKCKAWVHCMATIKARTVALAAVFAAGAAAVAEPARSDPLAFSCTLAACEVDATMELFSGSTLLATVSSHGFQGSILDSDTAVPPSFGGPNSANTSYPTGVYQGNLVADYFVFDLTGVTTQQVTSAVLTVAAGAITNNLTLNLSGISSQTVDDLMSPELGNTIPFTTVYNGLVSGASYGSFSVSEFSGDPATLLTFSITDSTALAEINEDVKDGMFGVAGTASGGDVVPEPSTWLMMLAGFAGLGFVARRRAARRRAAASAC